MTTQTTPSQHKRLIFVTGDKGGVGKSFAARTLLQYHIDGNRPCHAFDIDPANPCLHQFYPENTVRIDLAETDALDQIHDDIEYNQLILVDCAARSLRELNGWFREVDIMAERESLDFGITFVFVVTPDKSCTAIMSEALDMFGHEGAYLVIKNTAMGKDFSIYENSKLRKRLLEEFQGKEIILPTLLERTVVLLDRYDIGFRAAIHDRRATLSDRSRVHGFLRKAYAEFETVKEILGA